ncbi:MAG: Na/Pi cotransporter family protein [Clostridiales bacterium]|nr:Na/Pi cotransporter family protein [Clostridiales bacterium]
MEYQMLIFLAGGLGLFLYGMKMMGDGLEKAAGKRLKNLLEVLTTNRFIGVLIGAVITAIIQSSSATTVMVVGFVNAGIMSLVQATGVIMGANVGTTITGQLIAFNLSNIAPISTLIGVGLIFFSKKKSIQRLGEILAGFGILFLGLDMMSNAMEPLGEIPEFREMLVKFKHPLWGMLAGVLMTAIIQSSSASIGILQALAMQGIIGIDGAIFMLFGQNIGTCITALMASIGTNVMAKRTATIHLLFNVLGTVLFLALILLGVPYVQFIESLTPGNLVRQIANGHTLFNVFNTIILFPFSNYLVKISEGLVKSKKEDIEDMQLMFLDKRILETPPIAIVQIGKEIDRMGALARDNVKTAMRAFLDRDEDLIEEIYKREELINYLNMEITDYLVQVNGLPLGSPDSDLIGRYFHVVNDLERIGDHSENLIEYTEYIIREGITFSETAVQGLIAMKEMVLNVIDNALAAMKTEDMRLAKNVDIQEQAIDDMEVQLRDAHIDRLINEQCSVQSGVIFLDIVSNLERIADHASNLIEFLLI